MFFRRRHMPVAALHSSAIAANELLGAVGATFTSVTSPGTISITDSALNGQTPKAALFFNNRSVSAFKADMTHAEIAIGATDGTSQFACLFSSADGSTSSAGTKAVNGMTTNCYVTPSTSGDINEEAAFDSWQADGVVIDQTDAGPSAWKAQAAFLAHDDLTVKVGTVTPTTGGAAIDVGFQPDAVILVSSTHAMDGTPNSTFTRMVVGFAAWDGAGTISEAFATTVEDTGNTRLYRGGVQTDACFGSGSFTADSYVYTVNLTRGASGFTATSSASAGTHKIGYIAIKIDGGSARVGTWALPTSTGLHSKTGVGIAPGFVFLAGTDRTAVGYSAGTTFGFAVMADDIASIVASRVSDGAASGGANPTDQRTTMDNSGLFGLLAAGGTDFDIDFVSLDPDGWTVNAVDAPAAAYLWPYLALSANPNS